MLSSSYAHLLGNALTLHSSASLWTVVKWPLSNSHLITGFAKKLGDAQKMKSAQNTSEFLEKSGFLFGFGPFPARKPDAGALRN